MEINWGVLIVTTLITSTIGGIVSIVVEYYKEKVKEKARREAGKPKAKSKRRSTRSTIIGLFLGGIVGILAILPTGYLYQNRGNEWVLWNFEKSSESWTYLRDPQDASTNASWDAATKSLRAEFDFTMVDLNALPEGAQPHATFWVEGFSDNNWTGYNKLVIDVANLNSQLLEMNFSFYVAGCFYEFGRFPPIPPQPESTSITFLITEPEYKTCTASEEYKWPATFAGLQQFYIIIGTNDDPANVKGAILIDNIRLEK